MSILQLFEPNQKIYSGEIIFDGKKISDFNRNQMEKVRGNDISMIFQEPMSSLNPVFTVEMCIRDRLIEDHMYIVDILSNKYLSLIHIWIQNLKLNKFRNYLSQNIEFNENINIFLGDNAQGKTNLLESIYYLAKMCIRDRP